MCGKVAGSEVKSQKKQLVAMNSGGGHTKSKNWNSMQVSDDLFDIVKGKLLDEGLSEEEIKDIMLTLTPDEIMKEMNQGPSTPVKNYGDSPDKPKILPNCQVLKWMVQGPKQLISW